MNVHSLAQEGSFTNIQCEGIHVHGTVPGHSIQEDIESTGEEPQHAVFRKQ